MVRSIFEDIDAGFKPNKDLSNLRIEKERAREEVIKFKKEKLEKIRAGRQEREILRKAKSGIKQEKAKKKAKIRNTFAGFVKPTKGIKLKGRSPLKETARNPFTSGKVKNPFI